jgi:transposase
MKALVSDALWVVVAPLLPLPPSHARGGRPRVPDRAVLSGILYVLRTGLPWEYLPQELGCGSGMTGWRRLRAWQAAGVWRRVPRALLTRLSDAHQLDWSRASVDAARIAATKGAPPPARLRRIAAHRARSAMLWSMPRAFRAPAS